MQVGTRVIAHPGKDWVSGARESMEGRRGTVAEVAFLRHRPANPAILVKFDERPAPWSSHQVPSHSWWFDEDELERDVPNSLAASPHADP